MNKQLAKEIALSALSRHGTQALGGALVATGIGSGSDAEIVVGLVMNAIAFGWSAWRKVRQQKR